MDIRLKEAHIELSGEKFTIRCNFNVLAEIEEEHGGLSALLRCGKPMTVTKTVLACMLNDFADEQGNNDHYTPATVGRIMPTDPQAYKELNAKVMDLLYSAIRKPDADAAAEGEEVKN